MATGVSGTSCSGLRSLNGSGGFSINVAAVKGSNGHAIAYSYSLTATDAAGNTSGTATVAGSDTK